MNDLHTALSEASSVKEVAAIGDAININMPVGSKGLGLRT